MSKNIDLCKYIFHNCPKDHAWIVYQNITLILHNSIYKHYSDNNFVVPKITDKEQILYVHSVNMNEKQLYAIIETNDGIYYIENQKHGCHVDNDNDDSDNDNMMKEINEKNEINNVEKYEGEIVSNVVYYPTLLKLVENVTKSVRQNLYLKKIKNMKMTEKDKTLNVYPYQFINKTDQQIQSLLNKSLINDTIRVSPQLTENIITLDLGFNFTITDNHLSEFNPKEVISKLSFHTNFRLNSFNFVNSEWSQNIRRLNISNMSHFKNNAVGYLTHKLTSLRELYISSCPQVDIRCLLDLLSINRLEILCFYDSRMVCQPNRYNGLITDDEWATIKNESLQELMIKSDNLSNDIIDYIKDHCYVLKRMILSPKTLKYMCQNITNSGDHETFPLFFNDGKNPKELKVGRNFKMKNLIKNEYQAPFSDSMTKIMKHILEEEEKEENPKSMC